MSATAIQLNTPEMITVVKPTGVNGAVDEGFTSALTDAQRSANASPAQTSTSTVASVKNDSGPVAGTQTGKSVHEGSITSGGKPCTTTNKKKLANEDLLLAQPDASFLQLPPQHPNSLQTAAITTEVTKPVLLKESNSTPASTPDTEVFAVTTGSLSPNAAMRSSGVVDATELRTSARVPLNFSNAEACAERVLPHSMVPWNFSADCNTQPGENSERAVDVAAEVSGASNPRPNAQVISTSDASTANDSLGASTHEKSNAASGSLLRWASKPTIPFSDVREESGNGATTTEVVFAPHLPTDSVTTARSDASLEPQLPAGASTTEMPASHNTVKQIGLEQPHETPENMPLTRASHQSKDALGKVRDQAQTTDKHAHAQQHMASRGTDDGVSTSTDDSPLNAGITHAPEPTTCETRTTQIHSTSAASVVADARPSQVLDRLIPFDSNAVGLTTVEAQPSQAVQKAESYPQVVQEAKLVQQLNGSEWHVRLQVPDLGHIDIRTSAREGATQAQLSVERADVHRIFAAGDAELGTALARHNIEFSGTTLFQSSTGDGARQHDQAWQSPQQHHPAPASGPFSNRESGTLEPAAQTQPGSAGRSLNILA